jgi:hypothetical protein
MTTVTIVILGLLCVYFMISDYLHFSKIKELEEENEKLREELRKK